MSTSDTSHSNWSPKAGETYKRTCLLSYSYIQQAGELDHYTTRWYIFIPKLS